jgi:hypothetical protein
MRAHRWLVVLSHQYLLQNELQIGSVEGDHGPLPASIEPKSGNPEAEARRYGATTLHCVTANIRKNRKCRYIRKGKCRIRSEAPLFEPMKTFGPVKRHKSQY